MGEKKEKRVGKNDFLQPKKKKSADKDVDEQFKSEVARVKTAQMSESMSRKEPARSPLDERASH